MASAEITIDKNNKIFSTSFTIKQFIVHNNSIYNLYIRRGGVPATIKDYDYVVAPNSDFTSGQISENTLSIYTTALNFLNPAKIQAYDYLYTQPNNTPYLTNQTVSNVNQYPITITPDNFGSVYFKQLPRFQVDNFSNVNFTFKGGSLESVGQPNANIGGAFLFVSGINLSGFMADGSGNTYSSDTVVSFSAPYLNTDIQPQFFTPLPFSQFTVNNIINNQFIIRPNIPVFSRFDLNQLITIPTTNFWWGVVKPPAFYLDLQIEGIGFNYNFDITIETYDILLANKIIILPTTNFTGISANGYLLKPKLVNNLQHKFIKVTITNHFLGSPNLFVDVWNYSS